MIITIDGPAGSGKSAAALLLAQRLGLPHLDTGAMYRAVTLAALRGSQPLTPDFMAKIARSVRLDYDWASFPARILLEGQDVSEAIRTPAVTEKIYLAADNPDVRAEMVTRQRRIGDALGSLVTEGRDQGTVVFPDADYKFYLDAKPEVRAQRRVRQLATKNIRADVADILQKIKDRDQRDASRAVGPMALAEDARVVDTSHLSLPEVVETLMSVIRHGSVV